MKRMLSLLMALAMLVCLLPYGNALAAPEGDSHQDQIDRMNALLNGLTIGEEYTQKDVAQWSDEAVARAIYRKLNWDYQYSDYLFTQQYKAKSEEVCAYDLAGIDKLTRSCYGRDFPRNGKAYGLEVSGDQVILDPSAGENTVLAVQDFEVLGEKVIAVGICAWFGGPMSSPEGYFQAEFRKNKDSIYGLTLISLKKIQGNQDFSGLVADASTELKETTVTHYAQRVLDGKLETAWCEGVKGVGVGEWIRISNAAEKELEIIAIEVKGGYQADQKRLDNNGWPTELLIECEGGYSQKVEFYDYDAVFLLDMPVKTDWVKLTILNAMPGEKYEDTCISEIRLLGLDMDKIVAQLPPEETKPQETEPRETQPEVTTAQTTQPEKTQPADTKPAAPVNPFGDGGSGGEGKTENSGLWVTVIVAVAALAVGIVMGLLLRSRKKRTAPRQPNAYPNPRMYPPAYPQSAPQNWQNPPNAPQAMPQNPKSYPQQPQPNPGQNKPQDPGQQG